jgi:beta-xylosidase
VVPGHGTLVDDVNGNWWIMYHGYEKHFQTLGRQTLLLPIEWTSDNWFRVPVGVNSSGNLPLPAGAPFSADAGLSDDFPEMGRDCNGSSSNNMNPTGSK